MLDLQVVEQFVRNNWQEFLEYWTPVTMISVGVAVFLVEGLGSIKASYGRYSKGGFGLSAPIAWFLQEVPAFLVPLGLLIYNKTKLFDQNNQVNTNFLLCGYFMIHYFNRFDFFL
jgi:hypothetical protein